MSEPKPWTRSIQTKFTAGILTVIPILVVWVVLDFIFSLLVYVGAPVARTLGAFITQSAPCAAPYLDDPVLQWLAAISVALLLLYVIGTAASRVLGMRFIAFVETFIARIPLVEKVYSASKKLIGVLQQTPGGGSARVVLIEFPRDGMKAIGIVMRVFIDEDSGEEMAAVYVPTTPNPTSGYLELTPLKSLTPTDMTMDQAMTMIVSGGAIAPDRMRMGPMTGSTLREAKLPPNIV